MITTRSFLSTIIKAAIAPAILPSALTYGRKWVKDKELYIAYDIACPNYTFYLYPINT